MLTQKAKYALRALAVLAEAEPGVSIPTHVVAQRARAPSKFLEAILLELRRHGFVRSLRGKAGGYALAAAPRDIALGSVIRAVDGPLAPIACASLTAYRPCEDCPQPETCTIRLLMRRVRDATAAILDGTTLADLLADASLVQIDNAA